jgi:hypothetical protein
MTRGEGIVNLNKAFGDDAYYNKGSLYYKIIKLPTYLKLVHQKRNLSKVEEQENTQRIILL